MSAVTKKEETFATQFDDKKLELLKTTICKGSTDDEFQLFVHVCQKTGLDPFMKQVYAVKRYDSKERKEVMSIQTSIDGFRLIAERTGCYAPGREPTYTYDDKNNLISATSYVKKMTRDGSWHEVAACAHYEEYVQCFKDKETGKMNPSQFWNKMPHVMLAKCAESLALRKAFPAELSGLYTQEEMSQASRIDEPKLNKDTGEITIEQRSDDDIASDFSQMCKGLPELDKMSEYLDVVTEKRKITMVQFMQEALNDKEKFVKYYRMWIAQQHTKKPMESLV